MGGLYIVRQFGHVRTPSSHTFGLNDLVFPHLVLGAGLYFLLHRLRGSRAFSE